MAHAGYWSPLVWLASFVIVLAIALLIRSRGEKGFKHGTEQTLPFFSGNVQERKNIHSSNLYWGFTTRLSKQLRLLTRAHTGIVNDYAFSFVLLAILLMAALIFGGLA
jgi:hypothetical protein